MSKPTPQNLQKKELKRKAERKLSRLLSPMAWAERKDSIKKHTLSRNEHAKMMAQGRQA